MGDETIAIKPPLVRSWAALGALYSPIFGLWFLSPAALLSSLVLFFGLWALAVWDSRTFRLPNPIVLALFIAGFLVTLAFSPAELTGHLVGAGIGLLFPIALNFCYRRVRGRDGIGMGDAKLLAAAGIWTGWQALPYILLIASCGGLLFVFTQIMQGKGMSSKTRLPFGPFLSLGIWVVWLFM